MGGGERNAVVAANVGGQPALLEEPLKHSKSVVFPGGRKSLTSKEKPAGMIGDRQRIAVALIPEQELSLVVGAPQFVRTLPYRQSGSLSATTHPTATFDQAVAIQHRMDRAFGRNRDAGEPGQQALSDF